MLVYSYSCRINKQCCDIFVRQPFKCLLPNTFSRPSSEPDINSVPVTKPLWQVAPRYTAFSHIHNGIDEQTVINTFAFIPRLARQLSLSGFPFPFWYCIPP